MFSTELSILHNFIRNNILILTPFNPARILASAQRNPHIYEQPVKTNQKTTRSSIFLTGINDNFEGKCYRQIK